MKICELQKYLWHRLRHKLLVLVQICFSMQIQESPFSYMNTDVYPDEDTELKCAFKIHFLLLQLEVYMPSQFMLGQGRAKRTGFFQFLHNMSKMWLYKDINLLSLCLIIFKMYMSLPEIMVWSLHLFSNPTLSYEWSRGVNTA